MKTTAVTICTGPYAPTLVDCWHEYDESYESENDPVDGHPDSQLYVVFFTEDGGQDLERFELRSFEEARSLLFQVPAIDCH